MKFEIPNLEEEIIACLPNYKTTTMKKCFKCKLLNKCFEENIQQLKNKIKNQCENNNYIKFCQTHKCENCNDYTYDIGAGGFYCPYCKETFSLSKSQLKIELKKDYEKIDITELNEKINQLKLKLNLIREIQKTNEEETKSLPKLHTQSKEINNIINFRDVKRND